MEIEPAAPRTDTAISPVIRGEPVDIPTPVWGALVQEDLRKIEEVTAASPLGEGVLHPRPRRLLGWLSLLMFAVTAVLHGFAVAAAGYLDVELGVALAWCSISASVAAVALGIVAAVLGRGRWLGVLGAVGGFLANPWIVLVMLRWFGS